MTSIQDLIPIRLCFLHRRHVAGGFTSGWHQHDFFEIGFVLEGTCSWQVRGKKIQHLSEGQAILVPSGHGHREISERPVRLGWIGFDPITKISPKLFSRSVSLGAAAPDIAHLIQSIYTEQNTQQTRSAEICSLALHHILILFERAASSHPASRTISPLRPRQIQIAQSLAAYLDQNIGQPFSLEQVAEYHHLSAAHLSLLFQKHYRITPTAYRLQKRLARARQLLQETPRRIKEIAASCGFTDAAHFCKEFRKQTGITPGQARMETLT